MDTPSIKPDWPGTLRGNAEMADGKDDHLAAILRGCASEIERLEAELEATEFWKNWCYPDGMTADQVRAELTDYHMILEAVPVVYEAVTGGKISKPHTSKEAVLAEFEEHLQSYVDDAFKEGKEAGRDEVEAQLAVPRTALQDIDALDPMEINTANYDHVDVERLNTNAVEASLIARQSLATDAGKAFLEKLKNAEDAEIDAAAKVGRMREALIACRKGLADALGPVFQPEQGYPLYLADRALSAGAGKAAADVLAAVGDVVERVKKHGTAPLDELTAVYDAYRNEGQNDG